MYDQDSRSECLQEKQKLPKAIIEQAYDEAKSRGIPANRADQGVFPKQNNSPV